MKTKDKINTLLLKPRVLADLLLNKCSRFILSDKLYISLKFRLKMGYWIDLKHPKTFNEKLQWLKLNDHNPQYSKMVDKYDAKHYISGLVGEEYIVPTLGVWNTPEEIDYSILPEKFVLKVTHDSGGIFVCRNKANIDKFRVHKLLSKALTQSYFSQNREWPYKNASRRIIAEQYLGENLQDYRFYCFNGEPKFVYSYTNVSEADGSKPEPTYCDIMNMKWAPMPFRQMCPPSGKADKPEHFEKMVEIAKRLSKDIPFLRVDFYDCGKLYIGELTFYPGSGMSKIYPFEWDEKLGGWLNIK